MTKLIEHYYKQNKETRDEINRQYDEWVSHLPCCITNSNNVGKPHHLRYSGYCGIGLKPPDIFEIPITYHKHIEIHSNGAKTFAKKYNVNFIDILTNLHNKFIVENELIGNG